MSGESAEGGLSLMLRVEFNWRGNKGFCGSFKE